MKWLKKWSYLFLLIGMGFVYLSCVDKWQVYAEPIARVKAIYSELSGRALPSADFRTVGDGTESGSGVSDGDGAEGGTGSGALGGDGAEGGTGSGVSGGDRAEGGAGEGAVGTEDGTGEEDMSAVGGSEEAGEPVYAAVEDDYFSDAVFIGDSRTVGMYEYGGLEDIAAFYASTGLTVYKIFDSDIVTAPGQKKKITVEEALQQNSFHKIYLMVGINEMGTGTVETFTAKYKEVVDHLLELQPEAILYIQGIMKVTTERSNQGDYINNEGIEARNDALSQMADNKRIFYLDVNPEICDETGGMIESYTFDGVHLKAQYVEIWKDFLKSHAIQQK